MIDGLIDENAAISGGRLEIAGARGGVKPPTGDKSAVNTHINRYVQKIEKLDKGKKAKTEDRMKLKDLMEEHPGIVGEIEAIRQEAYEKGQVDQRENLSRIAAVLASPDYGDGIKKLAQEVVEGKRSFDAFDGALIAYDALKADKTISVAVEETEEAGETAGQVSMSVSNDGVIRSLDDIIAAGEVMKKVTGVH
jgi:ribosomal protein L19